MARRSRYGRKPCRNCGQMVSTNALARAAHEKSRKCHEAAAKRWPKKERKN